MFFVYHLHVAAHLSQSKTAFANMGGLYKANAGRIRTRASGTSEDAVYQTEECHGILHRLWANTMS